MAVESILEAQHKQWRKLAKRMGRLEHENAWMRQVIRSIGKAAYVKIGSYSTDEHGYTRCTAQTFTGRKRCQKKAEREGLCGQHWNMRWGHECVGTPKAGNYRCSLCGTRECSGKCPKKESINGKETEHSNARAAEGVANH